MKRTVLTRLSKVTAAVCISAFILVGCGGKAPDITGTWNGQDADGTAISYTFNEDGSGSCTSGSDTVSLEYKNDTENQIIWIKADISGQSTEVKLVYEMKKGQLVLTSDGASTAFTKAE